LMCRRTEMQSPDVICPDPEIGEKDEASHHDAHSRRR
jgi:hypothetical protein